MSTDLSKLYFVEEILVFLTRVLENGKTMPINKTLHNMQDLMDLRKEIRDGKLLPYVGDFTLDQQLWFAVAKYAKLVRDRDNIAPPTSTKENLPPGFDILDQLL